MRFFNFLVAVGLIWNVNALASAEVWGNPGPGWYAYQARLERQEREGFRYLGFGTYTSHRCSELANEQGYVRALFGGVIPSGSLLYWHPQLCFGSNGSSSSGLKFIVVPYEHTYEAAVSCARDIEWEFDDVQCRTQEGHFKFQCKSKGTQKNKIALVDCVESLFDRK